MTPLLLDKSFKGTLTDNIEDYPDGIVVPIDKPYRWTSADVVRKVKIAACRHFHKKNLKVGHAGTLDPLATGVLLVCIGKATKLAEEYQRHDKEYLAGVCFGATTPSYDREKEIDCLFGTRNVSEESVREALEGFLGEQEQIAPLFSAKSVDGVRAYEMARKQYKAFQKEGSPFNHDLSSLLTKQKIRISGIALEEFIPDISTVEAPPPEDSSRNMRINVIDTSSLHLPLAMVRVECSKGTYIRALARDLGEALGSGAFLDSLRRTRNGGFRCEDAISVGEAVTLL